MLYHTYVVVLRDDVRRYIIICVCARIDIHSVIAPKYLIIRISCGEQFVLGCLTYFMTYFEF